MFAEQGPRSNGKQFVMPSTDTVEVCLKKWQRILTGLLVHRRRDGPNWPCWEKKNAAVPYTTEMNENVDRDDPVSGTDGPGHVVPVIRGYIYGLCMLADRYIYIWSC